MANNASGNQRNETDVSPSNIDQAVLSTYVDPNTYTTRLAFSAVKGWQEKQHPSSIEQTPRVALPPTELFTSATETSLDSSTQGYVPSIMRRLLWGVRSGRLADIVLLLGCGEDEPTSNDQKEDVVRIPANRAVLAAASEFFNAMFNGNMKESSQDEIQVRGVEPLAMRLLVEYIHTGDLAVTESNVSELFTASCYLQMHEATEVCEEFLLANLKVANCLEFARLAEMQSRFPLLIKITEFVMSNFVYVTREDDFHTIAIEDLVGLIQSDDLDVESENEVFEACLRWVKCSSANAALSIPEEASSVLSYLLSKINLAFVQPSMLTDALTDGSLIQNDPKSVQTITGVLRQQFPQYDLDVKTRLFPRSLKSVIWFVSLYDSKIYEYNALLDSWTVVGQTANDANRGMALLPHGNLILVDGKGILYRLALKDIDFEAHREAEGKFKFSWQNVADSGCRGFLRAACAVLGGNYYIAYGTPPNCSVKCWDKNAWSTVCPMKEARRAFQLAALNDCLYAVGGHDGSKILDTVERYDPRTNEWSFVAPMLHRRADAGVVAAGCLLFAIGGYDHERSTCLSSVEAYDPQTNSWSEMNSMPYARSDVVPAVLHNKIYVIGGVLQLEIKKGVCVYNMATKTWSQTCHILRHGMGHAVTIRRRMAP